MFSRLSRNLTSRNIQRRSHLDIEALEDRALMSISSLALATSISPPPLTPPTTSDSAATSMANARVLDLRTVPHQAVRDTLFAGNIDMYRIHLNQGDFLAVDVDPMAVPSALPGSTLASSHLDIWNAAGQSLVSVGDSAEPDSGVLTHNPATSFTAPADGDYFLRLTSTNAAPAPYSLDVDRLVLAEGQQDIATLQQSGAMYAWLKADRLNITGPTGYGFALRGAWTQTVAKTGNLFHSTYTATGTVFVETALGEVPMTIPEGASFSVTTKNNVWGRTFGAVDSTMLTATIFLPSLTAAFGKDNPFGDVTVTAMDYVVNGGPSSWIGIKLGNDKVLAASDAPLAAAVPYLYLTVNPLSSTNAASATSFVNVIADPADPSLYIGADIPGVDIPVKAIGFSRHGLYPYTPVDAPSQWTGSLGGQFYIAGTIDLTALTGVPSEIDGDITLNLDPNHTGQLLGGTGVTASQLLRAFHDDAARAQLGAAIDKVFSNFSVGVNGVLKISPFDKIKDGLPNAAQRFVKNTRWINDKLLDVAVPHFLTVGHASLIYDGPTLSAYFRGSTVNPLANTPLAALASQYSVDIDAALKSGGHLFLDVHGKYQVAGFPATGEVLIVNDYSVSPKIAATLGVPVSPLTKVNVAASGVYAEQTVRVLGVDVKLAGSVLANGYFTVKGEADLKFGPLKGMGLVQVTKNASGVTFTVDLEASVDWKITVAGTKWSVKASLSGIVTVKRQANGTTTFSGSLHAKGKVSSPIGSAGFDLNAPIQNNAIVLKLPKIGSRSIALP